MTSIVEVLDAIAVTRLRDTDWASDTRREWQHPAWLAFMRSGEEKDLVSLPLFSHHETLPRELLAAMPATVPPATDVDRFLRACIIGRHHTALGQWLEPLSRAAAPRPAEFAQGCALLEQHGARRDVLARQLIEQVSDLQLTDGTPSPAGAYVLSVDESQMADLIWLHWIRRDRLEAITRLFAAHDAERWKVFLERLVNGDVQRVPEVVWRASLAESPETFVKAVAGAFGAIENWQLRFALGSALSRVDAGRFGPAMEALTHYRLQDIGPGDRSKWFGAEDAANWLITHSGVAAVSLLAKFIAASPPHEAWRTNNVLARIKNPPLNSAVHALGRDAIPLLDAAFDTEQPLVQLQAFLNWTDIVGVFDEEKVIARARALFAHPDLVVVAQAVRIAGAFRIDAIEQELWAHLSHRSKQVRDAAAASLAQHGDARLDKAASLWAARRADTRIATATWLRAVGTPSAVQVLTERLIDEENDDVRDAILNALESLEGAAMTADPATMRDRMARTLAKLTGTPAPWLDMPALPRAQLLDGSALTGDMLRYLVYRQSRVKEIRADIEARPLFAQVDRGTSGNLALAVLQAFIASPMSADDRWAMTCAALLGDDRIVPVMVEQVTEWADRSRGKLAEYGVQALALLGSDAALTAVDAAATRYRTKYRNIGQAASEAFAAAAERRGVAIEELGDLVVPWLGFAPGVPRVMDVGSSRLEIRVGIDHKLTLRDETTHKRVAKLPASAPAAVRTELKALTSDLKDAAAAQLRRMESLAVRQFRWPADLWTKLYLSHPLLLPFAQRLVWGAYDSAGSLLGTFRTLDDRTLTTSDDEPFIIPPCATVAIIHPLELTPPARQHWVQHIADHDVTPPFAQMERPVIAVTEAQQRVAIDRELEGITINGMSFRGRAEKRGWTRGSVCDAGAITHYHKAFPTAGVDVFVATDGMYVGMDASTEITLGRTFFAKHGSVRIGSYVYDEPTEDTDPRLVAFGDVPPIPFSEAMGDLARIAGVSATPNQETT